MRNVYLIFLFILSLSTTSFGQKILKTNSGQRILLIDNGSWRLLSPLELTDKSDNAIGDETSTSLEAFDAPQQGKNSISPDQRQEMEKLLTNFLSDEAQLCVNMEMSRRKTAQLKKELKEVKKDKSEEKRLKKAVFDSKKKIEQEEEYYKAVGKLIQSTKKVLTGEDKNPEKSIAVINQKFNSLEIFRSGMGGADIVPESNEDKKTEKFEIARKYPTEFTLDQSFDSERDYECELAFDGYDSAIGKNRKQVKTQAFFSYSQEKMKPYFKNEDFLNCDANISKVGKKYFLTLEIRIRSKDVTKTYGTLKENENIKIEMINGQRVYGRNINNDNGKIESYTGHTLYTGIYELAKDDINDLKKHYLDHIGIIWSSGYEEYDIYNVDFLKNQIKCLSK